MLPKPTAEDLISIGVTSVGHRRKLLDAIATLRMAVPTAVVAAPVPGGPSQVDAETPAANGGALRCGRLDRALDPSDPEDLRELIGDYHRAIAETVGHFDGFVAKYMGDGVLIYFGYPQAHEDDPEQAVRAVVVSATALSWDGIMLSGSRASGAAGRSGRGDRLVRFSDAPPTAHR